jgi:hypothetical protein
MKPIEFKQQNMVFAKNQPPYLPLPAYRYEGEIGIGIIHCWKLSLFERIKILFTARLWINVVTFGKPPQPIRPMVNNPFIENKEAVDGR